MAGLVIEPNRKGNELMSGCMYEARTRPDGSAGAYCITHQSYVCVKTVSKDRIGTTEVNFAPYPPAHADEVRIMARLNAIDAKLDAILKKLGT